MKKNSKLNISAWKKSTEFQKKLDNRIAYIIKYICNVFGCQNNYWQFYCYSNYEDCNSLDIKEFNSTNKFIEYDSGMYTNDDFGICIFDKNTNPSNSINKKFIDLTNGFPKRWIFEDFETELVVGRRKYRNWIYKKNQAKISKAKKAQDKTALAKEKEIAPIKNKLTKAELSKLEKHFKGNN